MEDGFVSLVELAPETDVYAVACDNGACYDCVSCDCATDCDQ